MNMPFAGGNMGRHPSTYIHQSKNSTKDTIMTEKRCECGKPVEQLVFYRYSGEIGMAFTSWTGNGSVCQSCTDALEFMRELKR